MKIRVVVKKGFDAVVLSFDDLRTFAHYVKRETIKEMGYYYDSATREANEKIDKRIDQIVDEKFNIPSSNEELTIEN